jgi:cytochrome c-type biogenesis protein CcmH
MKLHTVLGGSLLLVALGGHANPAEPLQAREMALAAQLRCVVCQNQTVAESHAPMAADMRREIRAQMEQGRSDAEVVAFFEQRYGAFVRYNPPWKPSTWLLWGGPFVVVIAGLLLLRRTLRRRQTPPSTLSAAQRQQVQTWLHQSDGKEQP